MKRHSQKSAGGRGRGTKKAIAMVAAISNFGQQQQQPIQAYM
jgi:hypothetical protein